MDPSKDWRDSSGRRLADYPRPSVAVDTAVLTVPLGAGPKSPTLPRSALSVLLVEAPDDGRPAWRLPGTFLHEGERLADAVRRSLAQKAGVEGLAPRQLQVFDEPGRDDRGWVLSAAHVAAVPWHRVKDALDAGRSIELRDVGAAHGLPFDHDEIVRAAVKGLREEYRAAPDPAAFLDEPFTLRQLQHMHEAVLGEELGKDSFRRRMEQELEEAGARSSGSVGKPARLFRRKR